MKLSGPSSSSVYFFFLVMMSSVLLFMPSGEVASRVYAGIVDCLDNLRAS